MNAALSDGEGEDPTCTKKRRLDSANKGGLARRGKGGSPLLMTKFEIPYPIEDNTVHHYLMRKNSVSKQLRITYYYLCS